MSVLELSGEALTMAGLGAATLGAAGWWLKRMMTSQFEQKAEELNIDRRATSLVTATQEIIKDQRAELKELRQELKASQDRTIEMALQFHATFERETSALRKEHQEVTRNIYQRLDQEASGHAECKARINALEQRDNIRAAVASNATPPSGIALLAQPVTGTGAHAPG